MQHQVEEWEIADALRLLHELNVMPHALEPRARCGILTMTAVLYVRKFQATTGLEHVRQRDVNHYLINAHAYVMRAHNVVCELDMMGVGRKQLLRLDAILNRTEPFCSNLQYREAAAKLIKEEEGRHARQLHDA